MKTEMNQFICPHCKKTITIDEMVQHQLEDEVNKKVEEKLHLQVQVEKKKIEERNKFQEEIQKEKEKENKEYIHNLEKELEKSSEKEKELYTSKAEITKLKREKQEIENKKELELQERITKDREDITKKIQEEEQQKNTMKLLEKNKTIEALKESLSKAQQQAEQGSVQLQGEVQEIAIADWLSEKFPTDTIERTKKGQSGADCLQIINTQFRKNCGSIYYESKRTKSFQASWIEKFKMDIQAKNADIGILVTQALPPSITKADQIKGIWVCSYETFKMLSKVLRESLIQINEALQNQTNKKNKMDMLYNFLNSNEFRLQIESIVEGFSQMKIDLETEKRVIQSTWKKREKQIEKVLLNTSNMYSSIKGIGENLVQNVPQLNIESLIKEE